MPYSGEQADMFSLAVLVFALHAGKFPFEKASPTDAVYSAIVNQKMDLFWQHHKSIKPEGFYSDEFVDLISLMLEAEPAFRLSILDAASHPFMQGEMPSEEEVRSEFHIR